MTLSDRINNLLDARNVKKAVKKYAWQKVADGHSRKQLAPEDGEQPVFVHVVGDKVYSSDKDLVNVVEITGIEADDLVASAKATMALRSTQAGASGGTVKSLFSAAEGMANSIAKGEMATQQPRNQQETSQSPAPHSLEGLVSMPSRERVEPKKRPQTYEEWMGF